VLMRKFLIVVGVLMVAVILFLVFGRKYYTKRFSPEDHVELVDGDFRVLVFYNRPYKKGREIFGGLVPYNKVWRTGANEATWFEINQAVNFNGSILLPGRYSLWTIPGKTTWKIILNSSIPPWGIDYNSEAARDPTTDALIITSPVLSLDDAIEQFTIDLEKNEESYSLSLQWDKTYVSASFSIASSAKQ